MAEPRQTLEPPATTVVTGAAGWLGTALVHRLLAEGRPRLRLLARDTAQAASLRALGDVHVVIGDIARSQTAARLLHDVDGPCDVIHAAGLIHPRIVRDLYEANADGTRHLARAARRAGVRRFVHVSSNSPFGTNPHVADVFRAEEPYHPYYAYGRSKMLAELEIADAVERGLDAVVVRPPWFYGPHQPPRQTTFFKLVRAGRFPVIGDGQQRRSMVYVGNLVDGVLAAELTVGIAGRGFWIADARPYTVTEIVATVGRALADEGFSVKPPGRPMPAIVGRVAELADRLIQRTGRYVQQVHVLGEMDKTIACEIGTSRRDLGYEPAVELYEGMRRSISWCVATGIEL
ncbi:MAG: nucleoside-diphosphate-sugar epimerase [Ilumatobacteraceae bacterium]|nr:nucleoside-diphosphate-sugar epimerase [Ilumatobacteraceae bacterium]